MPIIGIITRHSLSEEKHDINVVYTDIFNALVENNAIGYGIILDENYKEMINMFDGIIMQGGDKFEEYDLKALKYIYETNKPVLCICLGMQLMGILFDGELVDINNHKKKLDYAHNIKLNKNSKLYNIYKKDNIKVNSRHKSILKSTKLKVCAISNDGYIEAIEDSTKRFFVGVQWHPETMRNYDKIQNNIFKEFIRTTIKG